MTILDTVKETVSLSLSGDVRSIFLLASLYVLCVCIYSVIYQAKISRWPSTRGKLIHAGMRKFGITDLVPAQQEFVLDALYEYEIHGSTYAGKRISPWIVVASHNARALLHNQLKRIRCGGKGEVTVYYHPRKPEKSYLLKPGLVSQLITMALGAIPITLYFWKYLSA